MKYEWKRHKSIIYLWKKQFLFLLLGRKQYTYSETICDLFYTIYTIIKYFESFMTAIKL